MKCEIVDSLAHPGGQCTELYPDKPIYDIPGAAGLRRAGAHRPAAEADQAVPRRVSPRPGSHRARAAGDDGRFDVETAAGTRFDAGSVDHRGRPRFVPAAPAPGARRGALRRHAAALPRAARRGLPRQGPADRRRRRQRARLGARILRQGARASRSCTGARNSAPRRHRSRACRRSPPPARCATYEGTIQSLAIEDGRLVGATIRAARDKSTVDVALRARARLLRPASEARPDRGLGPGAREEGAQGRHREIPDQRARASSPSATSTPIRARRS